MFASRNAAFDATIADTHEPKECVIGFENPRLLARARRGGLALCRPWDVDLPTQRGDGEGFAFDPNDLPLAGSSSDCSSLHELRG